MTRDRERAALAIFAEALDVPDTELAGWLFARTQPDDDLHARVLSLLAADKVIGADADDPAPLLPPDEISVYRLDALIGTGGMGSVYKARRSDGLFDQTVAIKVMRARAGSVDLAPLFDAERRVLARMDHEGIARILDGGQTDKGLSYLIMDFVEGAPLDHAADQGRLDAKARVALIRQVAAALAHAHQSGIVHCDVKPGNILVTAEGRTKLIDFGIARLQDMGPAGGLDGLTRAYASPARCKGEPARLTDDVYALAVTLFQILARDLPWADPERDDPDIPPRPLVISADLADGLRNPDDLTAIVTRALLPDAAARYPDIGAFDRDLARWEELRPVSAVPQRTGYVLRRLAQRRPGAVAATAGAALSLVAALIIITTLFLSAETARRAADARFADLRALARFMIFDLNTALEKVPGATPARLALSRQAQSYLDALGRNAAGNAALQQDVAEGLVRLAEVQGVPSRPNLGLGDVAAGNLDRAIALFDGLIATQPDALMLRASRGKARYLLSVVQGVYGQDATAQLALAQAAEADIMAALPAAIGAETGALNALLTGARLTQADAMQTQGDHAQALTLRMAEEARVLALTSAASDGMDVDYEAGRVAALVGDSHYWLGQFADAGDAYRRAAQRFRTGLDRDPLNRRLLNGLHYATWSLSAVLADLGDPAMGLSAAQDSAGVAQQLLDWDPTDRLAQQLMDTSQGQIALMLRANGRPAEALVIIDAQLARYRAAAAASPGDDNAARQIAVPLRGRAEIVMELHGKTAGCAAYAAARAAWEALPTLSAFDRDNDLATIIAAMETAGCG
jgi:tRNA A-37 threonylcarbamoyl transferase component Bud32/tetratricopeptide (TPR) repeat protein